jgi:hypothetical protein
MGIEDFATKSIERRYLSDPAIKSLVDNLECQIHQLQFTPSEIRECAMLAAIHYEMRRPPRPMFIPKENYVDMPQPKRD